MADTATIFAVAEDNFHQIIAPIITIGIAIIALCMVYKAISLAKRVIYDDRHVDIPEGETISEMRERLGYDGSEAEEIDEQLEEDRQIRKRMQYYGLSD